MRALRAWPLVLCVPLLMGLGGPILDEDGRIVGTEEFPLFVAPADGAYAGGGAFRTVVPDVRLMASFPYTINTEIATTTTTTTGTVTSVPPYARLQTGVGAAGAAGIQTLDAIHFLPNAGTTVMFAAYFSPCVRNSLQECGIGDATNGMFFGCDATSGAFGIIRRTGGATSFIPQTQWNVDRMDGLGERGLNPSGIRLVPGYGNVYRIQLLRAGYGSRVFMILGSDNRWHEVHSLFGGNSTTTAQTILAAQRIGCRTANTGDTTNHTINLVTATALSDTNPILRRVQGSAVNRKTGIGATETNVLTIRNNPAFGGAPHDVRVVIESVSANNTGSGDMRIRLVRNTALGGVPAYAAFSATTSVVDYDVAGTTLAGGRALYSYSVGPNNAFVVQPGVIRMQPGDMLTVAATQVSGGGTASPEVSVNWYEEW